MVPRLGGLTVLHRRDDTVLPVERGPPMAWSIRGRYFENCSCDMPCPCTVSFDAGADTERCNAVLVFHVDTGEVDSVDVSDRTVVVMADSPQVMTDGNWKLGKPVVVLLDN
jgi:hypothetical protein